MTQTSVCIFCGKIIICKGPRLRKWCNDSCRYKYRSENNLKYTQRNTYEEQVKRSKKRKLKAISLLGGGCAVCNYSHPAALSFHHIDPETKSFNLDGRVFGNHKWSVIEEELRKCKLMCLNCHALEHYATYWTSESK